MSLIQRKAKGRCSQPPLPDALTPVNEHCFNSNLTPSDGASSLTEARCNRIIKPVHDYYHSLVHWTNRMNFDQQAYPSNELIERAYVVGPKIAALKRQVTFPESGTSPEVWEEDNRKLARLEGQMRAIETVLEGRRKREMALPLPSRSLFAKKSQPLPVSPSSLSGSAPSILTADAEPDPFEGC